MRNLTARDLAPCHARPQRAGREEHQERDQVEQLAAVTKEVVGVRAKARARATRARARVRVRVSVRAS